MIFLSQITQKTTDYVFSVNICVICKKFFWEPIYFKGTTR
jgi:hypothetical protein